MKMFHVQSFETMQILQHEPAIDFIEAAVKRIYKAMAATLIFPLISDLDFDEAASNLVVGSKTNQRKQ